MASVGFKPTTGIGYDQATFPFSSRHSLVGVLCGVMRPDWERPNVPVALLLGESPDSVRHDSHFSAPHLGVDGTRAVPLWKLAGVVFLVCGSSLTRFRCTPRHHRHSRTGTTGFEPTTVGLEVRRSVQAELCAHTATSAALHRVSLHCTTSYCTSKPR